MATNEESTYPDQNNERSRNSSRNNVLLILLLLLFLGSVGVNIYQYLDYSKREQTANQEIFSSQDLQKQLGKQKDSALAQLEEFKGRNAKLDAEVDKAEKDIVAKADQISKLLKSNKINYNKYLEVKDKLDEMTYLKNKLMKQVEDLSEQNKQLSSQNQNLKQEVTEGKHTIDKLTDVNTSQKNRLELAARLKADNIKVTGVFFKKNNKEVESSKSKHIQKLKFCFTISENIAALAGKRDIFIQVVDPHGQTVAIESKGSGTTMVDGNQSQYSTKEEIDYNKETKDYCLYYGKDSPFEAGKYNIVISTEGYKLGEKEFTIK
jgi:cell division protein FtsB